MKSGGSKIASYASGITNVNVVCLYSESNDILWHNRTLHCTSHYKVKMKKTRSSVQLIK